MPTDFSNPEREFQAHIEQYRKAASELGITWSVTYRLLPDIDTCQIISDPQTQQHEVRLHPNVLKKPELFQVDVMHELCHAKISETTDSAFSTIRFTQEAAQGWQDERAEEFNKKANQLYLAWAHVDIWINDLRHDHWPELTLADITSFRASVLQLRKGGNTAPLTQPSTLMAIALNMAEAQRHLSKKAQPDQTPLLSMYGTPTRIHIKKLEAHFKTLPKLSGDKGTDLRVLEKSVQTVAKICNLTITPTLVEEHGQMVWNI